MADFNEILTPGDIDNGLINVVVEIPEGFLEARVIGVMEFVDDGEVDDKVIVVPADDRHSGNAIEKIEDLPKQLINQIEFHFNRYKDLKKPGSTEVKGFAGRDRAIEIIHQAIERWNNQ